jgi:hypothetical protein
MNRRQEFVAGLRELADFLESTPECPTPKTRTINVTCTDEAKIAEVARSLGRCEKFDYEWTIGLRRKFGSITFQVHWWHYKACKKVPVPGEKEVQYVSTGYEKREYPKFKWVCPPSFLRACCK